MNPSTNFLSISQLYSAFQKCDEVSIDSRTISKNAMFFALKGAQVDGNQYAEAAIKQGARFAVIDDVKYQKDKRFLLVEDTLVALQRLAKMYREQLQTTKWLAIIGSNGKTTTKELIYHILREKYKTHCTNQNFNNHIGVPLTILNIPTTSEIAVIEMGANHVGEHQFLCEIAQPNYGLITNCGKDHLEGYGSVAQVILSNTELFAYLRAKGGEVFVNIDDPILLKHSEGLVCHYYGSPEIVPSQSLLAAGTIDSYFPQVTLTLHTSYQKIKLGTQLYGAFQKSNILAAVAVGRYFGIPEKYIQQAIANYEPKNNRSQTIEWGSNTVFLDGYNANPTSVAAIVEDFQNYPMENKVLILGDMYELGTYTIEEHEKILTYIENYPYKAILLIGNNYAQCIHRPHFYYFKNAIEAREWVEQQGFESCYFLAKASRGVQIETIFF